MLAGWIGFRHQDTDPLYGRIRDHHTVYAAKPKFIAERTEDHHVELIQGAFLLFGIAVGAMFEAPNVGLVKPFITIVKEPGVNGRMAQSRHAKVIFTKLAFVCD
jgi:hypothetical protein